MTFEYLIKENGLNPATDLVLDDSIQFSLMAGAFSGSDAEYVTLFEPTASMIEAENKGYILTSVGEESGDIPYTAYCAKSSYIAENEDLIERFTRAIYKGLKWVEEHSAEEIANVILDQFPDTDVAMLT
jgi:NitT/TauT family transport system substrate-binding protein